MMAGKQAAPTQEEIQAAQAVLMRAQEARVAQEQERLQPIVELVEGKPFATVLQALQDIPVELLSDMSVAPHLIAARTGLNGLATLAGNPQAPEEAAPIPA